MPTFVFFAHKDGEPGFEYDRVTGWKPEEIESKMSLNQYIFNERSGYNLRKGIKTVDQFEQILKRSPKVVAKFAAKWCQPCRESKTPFEEAAMRKRDWMFVEIDVDDCETE